MQYLGLAVTRGLQLLAGCQGRRCASRSCRPEEEEKEEDGKEAEEPSSEGRGVR